MARSSALPLPPGGRGRASAGRPGEGWPGPRQRPLTRSRFASPTSPASGRGYALFWSRRIARVLALLLILFPLSARAEIPAEVLSRFASTNYDEIAAGVDGVAASGDAQAPAILEALAAGRLIAAPGAVAIRTEAGGFIDAATGATLAEAPAGGKPIRVNNRVRRAIDAAMGSLTLLAPDRAKRLDAAAAVFKSRDDKALPALEAALARETDPAVKQAFLEARAAIVLAKGGSDDAILPAIETVSARGDQEARALLSGIPNPSPAVAAAAQSAIGHIDTRLMIWNGVQSLYYGLSLGSVLLIAAIGLAITFGVMGVINMAHGEIVMLGAYTTFLVQEAFRTYAPNLFDYSLAVALPLAFLVAALAGVAIERTIIRFLYGRPLETLLATFGLSLILQQAVRTVFGPSNREVGNPAWMSGAFDLGGLTLTWNRMWIIVFALLVFAALMLVLRYTALGLQMRAVTQNRRMAAAMGIRTGRVDMLTFGIGSGVAGIAGVALSQIDNVSPNLGQGYIIDSFMVVVFGGVGNLWGTLVGALTLGVANKLLEPWAGAVLGKIAILVGIILFIQRKPRGLFPLKGRAVES
ncbi:MAG: urea ABC transporter permease subunit UrtB [Inquilinus limosus]|uniref:Urea ABC transporter permease subunit UrtB n=1 Tax=Inquilinus limosus TaxID=171674 RepID=A0A952KBK1_9PROT|nr:urea ABC transporter permease subunit UrtB [Inquilinus limosus]